MCVCLGGLTAARMAADDDGDAESAAADDAAGVGVVAEQGGAFLCGNVYQSNASHLAPPTGLDVELQEPPAALSSQPARPPGEPH